MALGTAFEVVVLAEDQGQHRGVIDDHQRSGDGPEHQVSPQGGDGKVAHDDERCTEERAV